MNTAAKIAKVFAKIYEILCWIAAVIVGLVFPIVLIGMADTLTDDSFIRSLGRSQQFTPDELGIFIVFTLFILICIAGFVLGALIYRNTYRALKLSCRSTPFQPDVVAPVRRVGKQLLIVFASVLVLWICVAAFVAVRSEAWFLLPIIAPVGLLFCAIGLFFPSLAFVAARVLEHGVNLQNELDTLCAPDDIIESSRDNA